VTLQIGATTYDPTDPIGRLLFNVLAMVAEFEADLISQRTKEGMAIAKAKGKLKGRPPKLSAAQEAQTINGETVSLYAKGGAIGVGQLDDTGTMTFTPLRRIRTHRNADKAGRYRWYNDCALPDYLGGGTVTVRLHGNDEDTKRKLNRTENVRPIPPTDPDFPGLFRQRNDAESINRGLDDTLFLRRAHSVGRRRQWLNLLGYALAVNSLALLEHERDAPASAAA
jgi:hypothetical protein